MFLVSHFCKMLFCVELSAQLPLGDYKYFTPERRIVLAKMGDFFDETVRNNFPAETDTLSYKYFGKCFARQDGDNGTFIMDVDRVKLKEINQMLFKDHNYYFFYARYVYLDKPLPDNETCTDTDSVPTVRIYRPRNQRMLGFWWLFGSLLNPAGYIKTIPEDNFAVRDMHRDLEAAGAMSISMFASNILGVNVRETSNPVIKELCAVVFWRYLCICGGVNLAERKNFCETCVD